MDARGGTAVATGSATLTHRDWMRLASEEYRRLFELIDGLDDTAWSAPTDCAGWDVHAIVAHLNGAAAATASIREFVRQARAGSRILPDADTVDAMNEIQVRERADHSPAELAAELRTLAPQAVRARTRVPGPLRALPIRFGPPLGTKPFGYLSDRIYTRDAWLHRVDISRATGTPLTLTPGHDGAIVADVVDEWASLHGQPFELELTGMAGGRRQHGTGGEQIEIDAVEFCRVLSGRGCGQGLLATRVNF